MRFVSENRPKISNLMLGFFLVCSPCITYAANIDYLVKSGETLSGILYEKDLKPIYGKNGMLKIMLELNPQLKKRKRNRIYPGEIILILERDLKTQPISDIQAGPIPAQVSEVVNPDELPVSAPDLPEVKKIGYSDFNLSATTRFVKLESTVNQTNAKAKLLSDSGIGYKISWGQHWSDRLRTSFNFEKYQVRILESSSAVNTIINKNQSLAGYQFGSDYKVTTHFSMASSIDYSQTLVSRAETLNKIVVEKFLSPKISLGANYTILSRDDLSLKTFGDLICILPAKQENYSSQLSYGYKFGLGLEDQILSFKVRGEFFYKNLDFKMTETEVVQTEVGMLFGLTRSFGEVK